MKNYLLYLVILPFFLFSQSKLEYKFNQLLMKEDFDTVSVDWPIVLTDDLFISIDNSQYYLNNNKNNENAVISSWINDLEYFKVETSFKLAPRVIEKPYLGIVTNSKDDGEKAIIFDLMERKDFE